MPRAFAGLLLLVFATVGVNQFDQPLRALAEARGKLIGTAVNTTVLTNDARYRDVLATTFSSVTPENAMKWAVVEPLHGSPDYAAADRLVEFAHEHQQSVRGHTLVWHNQVPAWLATGGFSEPELTELLHAHITDEATHFAGELYAWDVVNEPFNDDGTWRTSLWYRAMGPDYVAMALQWAHAADPSAKLYLNDYNIESIGNKSDAMYALAQDLLGRGVPLDGIGFQAHMGIQNSFPSSLSANLQRFVDLGLDVAITEADIRMRLPADGDRLATQSDYYGRLLQSCAAIERCVSFTVWGFTDAHSWVPTAFAGQGAATLFDENYNPKPAYFAVRDLLASQ